MAKSKIAVTIDAALLDRLDELVRDDSFANRSQAVEAAVMEKLDRLQRTRLANECSKLDPDLERRHAEEGLETELSEWPRY